jgi:hypothetical protein
MLYDIDQEAVAVLQRRREVGIEWEVKIAGLLELLCVTLETTRKRRGSDENPLAAAAEGSSTGHRRRATQERTLQDRGGYDANLVIDLVSFTTDARRVHRLEPPR